MKFRGKGVKLKFSEGVNWLPWRWRTVKRCNLYLQDDEEDERNVLRLS